MMYVAQRFDRTLPCGAIEAGVVVTEQVTFSHEDLCLLQMAVHKLSDSMPRRGERCSLKDYPRIDA